MNDEPELMASDPARLEEARPGQCAGGTGPADPVAEQIMHPTAERLLRHCDAVLRLAGESTGADEDVRIATERGLPVYHRVEDVQLDDLDARVATAVEVPALRAARPW
ncbi:hypothetical protein ACBR40_26455 [Nonomuraea sp. AD125B]|uniref:hypothetical protein n=1 Tax=Nonomuraea sp. AD125B TaxID=3242897 RepID=UPI003528F099